VAVLVRHGRVHSRRGSGGRSTAFHLTSLVKNPASSGKPVGARRDLDALGLTVLDCRLSRCTDFGLPTATTGESAERVRQAALAEAAKAKGWEERQRLRKAAGRPGRRPRWLLLIQGSRHPLKLRYMSPLSL
jgi:hypothetical protein